MAQRRERALRGTKPTDLLAEAKALANAGHGALGAALPLASPAPLGRPARVRRLALLLHGRRGGSWERNTAGERRALCASH